MKDLLEALISAHEADADNHFEQPSGECAYCERITKAKDDIIAKYPLMAFVGYGWMDSINRIAQALNVIVAEGIEEPKPDAWVLEYSAGPHEFFNQSEPPHKLAGLVSATEVFLGKTIYYNEEKCKQPDSVPKSS